jgi:DNA-binding transcriptional ArsR family regulator
MADGPSIARIGAALGDHTRAEVLSALLADRALTASELASLTGVTKPTISAHLSRLREVGLVTVTTQGRHRYFSLADRDVAALLESMMGVAFRAGAVPLRPGPREPALRRARLCYDHLAGELGVLAFEALVRRRLLAGNGAAVVVTPLGRDWFGRLGIDVDALAAQRRTLCRPCLDWSERRSHLAGSLGTALLERIERSGWARRVAKTRVVAFTRAGERSFRALLAGEGRQRHPP